MRVAQRELVTTTLGGSESYTTESEEGEDSEFMEYEGGDSEDEPKPNPERKQNLEDSPAL
jgi:hypothetical protein